MDASNACDSVVEDTTACAGGDHELKGEPVEGLGDTLKLVFAESQRGCPDPSFRVDYALLADYREHPEHLQHFRDSARAQAEAWKHPKVNADLRRWYGRVTIRPLEEMGGHGFHPESEPTHGYVVQVNGAGANQPCMVYFHGGACIAGDPGIMQHVLARYAVQCDMTVVCSSYRLAPECPVPLAGKDAYAAVKWVLANGGALGIDPARVTVWGESGGSKTAMLCAMNFAERNEGHLLKFFGAFASVTGNQYLRGDPGCLYPHESRMQALQAHIARCFTPDYEAGLSDPWVHPNLMPDELCRRLPPAVVYTGEFCSTRSSSEEARDLFRRNGRLLAFGCLGGHSHVTWAAMDLPASDAHYLFVERIVQKYL